MRKIDSLDSKIIELLRENPRIKAAEIAEKTEKNISTISRRLKKLQRAEILETTITVNPEKILDFLNLPKKGCE